MSGEPMGWEGRTSGGRAVVARAAVGDTLRRARTLLEQHQTAEAQQLYRGVLAIEPSNLEALHLLGIAYFHAGDPQRAEPFIARSLHLGLGQAWNFTNHGTVLIALGQHREALAVLDRALKLDPKSPLALVARGNGLLALERHGEAQMAYESALAVAPGLAEAWSNRGNVLRALKRPADALISLDTALQIAPNDYATHVNRGQALRDLGRREEALHSYRLALVIRPKSADLLALCGAVLTELERVVEALACYDEARLLQPDDTRLLYQSCVVLDLLHRYEELLPRCDRLVQLEPRNAVAWLARGNALQGLHRHAEAADAYGEAITLAPGLHDALRNRAAALRMLGRYAEALEDYDRALGAAGPDVELLYNRGVALQHLGRYDDALSSYEAAVDAPIETALACFTRAVSLQQLKRDADALDDYRRAQAMNPNFHLARRSEAFCHLLMGHFAEGWPKFESRWEDSEAMAHRRHADRPLWLGVEPLAGKTILLHAEQGYGDTLQFCRFASLVGARGATVVLEVPAALKKLLSELPGVSRVVSEEDVLPSFDLQCPLMSLPLALGIELETIPTPAPYLRADPSRRQYWSRRLDELDRPGRLRVGLAWSGNPRHNNDENRSILLSTLAPLFECDATFVSLQPLVRERDAAAWAQSGMIDFGAGLEDFSDTAALVDALDLVISVDTSVAHLAGALGQPVWVLLPRVPDWRWLLDREDSPWYSSARLFRQDGPGDWPALVARVVYELRGWGIRA